MLTQDAQALGCNLSTGKQKSLKPGLRWSIANLDLKVLEDCFGKQLHKKPVSEEGKHFPGWRCLFSMLGEGKIRLVSDGNKYESVHLRKGEKECQECYSPC